jgi:hypothetical protein
MTFKFKKAKNKGGGGRRRGVFGDRVKWTRRGVKRIRRGWLGT